MSQEQIPKYKYTSPNGYISSLYYLLKKYNQFVKTESIPNIDKLKVLQYFSKQKNCNIITLNAKVNSSGDIDDIDDTDNILYSDEEELQLLFDDYETLTFVIEIEEGIILDFSAKNLAVVSLMNKNTENIKKQLLKNYTSKSSSKIYMIAQSSGDLYLQSLNISKIDNVENILLNYNKDFEKSHNRIIDSLQDTKKGIVLLHGIPGSGKTYYLKYLTNIINKKFVWIPSHMTSVITDSNFCSFILGNCKNSILIIEDAEKYLQKRESVSDTSASISNILNITDGMISDALGLQLICTFNCKDSMIDDAILRSGRLIEKYEFKHLDIDVAKAVANRLNKKIDITKPTSLADIYNSENIKTITDNGKEFVGFSTK